jgi:hypothetical protein
LTLRTPFQRDVLTVLPEPSLTSSRQSALPFVVTGRSVGGRDHRVTQSVGGVGVDLDPHALADVGGDLAPEWIRSMIEPGQDVDFRSRWPTIRGKLDGCPDGQWALSDPETSVVLALGSTWWIVNFHASTCSREYRAASGSGTFRKSPRMDTPVDA